MGAPRTARDRARAELTAQIKDTARRQLATGGADRLSLRAVARELGMVSSAVYRYFPSRDDLLTALIVDAYDALGSAAEMAETAVPRADRRGRWRAVCGAVRRWARRNPHEYALIYGSPVPGYRAPADTVAPAVRVPLLMVAVVRETWEDAALARGDADRPLPPVLAAQVEAVTDQLAPSLPAPVMTRLLVAWTQLFGMVSFELFGQLVGSVDPADAFFDHTVDEMADFVGLPS
jgi:AcrR family transcriptional regulator